MDTSEVARMHAPDERISVENIQHAVNFYATLIEA
jgi:acetylornithine deacetylase/succinyl-diaminopimelate desuccinylase-like protein